MAGTKKVKMVAGISGTLDGVDYPKPGEVGEFPVGVADDLISNGYAVDPKDADVEKAVAPPAETSKPAGGLTKESIAPKKAPAKKASAAAAPAKKAAASKA